MAPKKAGENIGIDGISPTPPMVQGSRVRLHGGLVEVTGHGHPQPLPGVLVEGTPLLWQPEMPRNTSGERTTRYTDTYTLYYV